ncbi:type II toxin-antitoxin system RelE family toxin [Streptomyces sp. LE64]|uniref:type II toxin-antitoxin system RelE family toxin n=1 Tax=Streptomyces sp. LE64 TaxID=3448653 RepID=UPI004040F6B4
MSASTYRVQYSDVARASVAALPAPVRRSFDTDLRRLAADPYDVGSRALKEQDYRQALVGGCIVSYYVSTTVRIVSVTRVQGPP